MNFGIHVSQCGFLELPTFKLSHLFLGPRWQNNQEIAFWPTWYFLVSRNYWTCRSVSSDPEYLPQGHPIGDMTRWKGSLKSHIQVVGKLSQMAKNVWPGRYLFFLTWFFSCLTQGDLIAVGVLSGNRNFEGRVHPNTRANYLASPPLVIAYAIAGTIKIDFEKEPLGKILFVWLQFFSQWIWKYYWKKMFFFIDNEA